MHHRLGGLFGGGLFGGVLGGVFGGVLGWLFGLFGGLGQLNGLNSRFNVLGFTVFINRRLGGESGEIPGYILHGSLPLCHIKQHELTMHFNDTFVCF